MYSGMTPSWTGTIIVITITTHQRLAAAEVELREGEAGERAEEDDRDRHGRGDDRRVDERAPEVDVHLARVEEAADVVAELRAGREHRRVAR